MKIKNKALLAAAAALLILLVFCGCTSHAGQKPYSPLPESAESTAETLTPTPVSDADNSVWFEPLAHRSTYACVYDLDQKELLYSSNNMQEPLYPASTTKLLTALTALKYAPADTVITVGDAVSRIGQGSSIAYIKSGHRLTVGMLIEAMIIPSGNDAAYALACGVGKIIGGESLSTDDAISLFVQKMNDYAAELGMADTHFTSPDGYHDDNHVTTLSDMLALSIVSVGEEAISQWAGMRSAYAVYKSGQSITWTNTNKMLNPESPYYYEGVCGLKTGSTDEAGCCLIVHYVKEGRELLVLIFDAPDDAARYADAKLLLDTYTQP